jgi:hypothetical protein
MSPSAEKAYQRRFNCAPAASGGEQSMPDGRFTGAAGAKSGPRCGAQGAPTIRVLPIGTISNACLNAGAPNCGRIWLDWPCHNAYNNIPIGKGTKAQPVHHFVSMSLILVAKRTAGGG